jgi:flagellar basal body-associated protein FliL
MRKTFLAAIVIVLIVVITGGVLGYTYLQGQTQPAPSNPAQATNEIENIRDQALTYVAANHTQTFT